MTPRSRDLPKPTRRPTAEGRLNADRHPLPHRRRRVRRRPRAGRVARAGGGRAPGHLHPRCDRSRRTRQGRHACGRRGRRVRFAAGVHPHHAGKVALDELERVVSSTPSTRHRPSRSVKSASTTTMISRRATVQREVFGRQVAMAVARDLPVVIHTREADADTLEVLDAAGAGRARGVFHCFTGDQALADAAVARGLPCVVLGYRDLPARRGAACGGGHDPAGPLAGRDRQPVPVAGAPARRAKRTGPGRPRPRDARRRARTAVHEAAAQAVANAAAVFGDVGPNR